MKATSRPPTESIRLLLLMAALAGCAQGAPPRQPRQLAVVPAGPSHLDRHLLTGELTAAHAVEIIVPDVGIRPLEIRWAVVNGAPVEAGDTLFELDNSDLAEQLDARRVAVLEARARIASIESAAGSKVADAEFELERRRAALEKARVDAAIPRGLRSDEEYERLQVELQKAERQVTDADRLLAAARATAGAEVTKERLRLGKEEAELRQVEGGIARLAVTAPMAGVVLLGRNSRQDRPWQVGDIVYPGHLLASLPDPATMMVRAQLFDVDDGLLEEGLRATVTLDAHPGLELGGRVRTIDRVAFQRDRGLGTRVFWVTVDLDSLDLKRMKPGMSVKVAVARELAADAGDRALVAPRESLDLSDPASPRALLRDGSWRAVALGACSALECVIEEGLDEGASLGSIHAVSAGGS